MTIPHPLFVPLHAHLLGVSELLSSGVPERRLLGLYPFELESYNAFFTDFFRRHPEKLEQRASIVELAASYRLLSEFLEPVEKRIVLGIYTDDQHDAYREAANEVLPPLAREMAAQIAGNTQPEFFTALNNQLGFFGRVMLLLSNWPAEEFEDDAALGFETRHIFFVGFERLMAYYGLSLHFDTERRRIDAAQVQRQLSEHDERFKLVANRFLAS